MVDFRTHRQPSDRQPLKLRAKQVWVPIERWRWLREAAARRGLTMQQLLSDILTSQAELPQPAWSRDDDL
jgi:hypothetical protein